MTSVSSPVIHASFSIERNYGAPPERVFAAFAEEEERRKWVVDDPTEYSLDFRPLGTETLRYRMKLGTPVAGMLISNHTVFLDIVPGSRIVTAATMWLEDKPMSATMVTFEFVPAGRGTTLVCTHQGAFFQGSDGPEMRQEGWHRLLDRMGASLA